MLKSEPAFGFPTGLHPQTHLVNPPPCDAKTTWASLAETSLMFAACDFPRTGCAVYGRGCCLLFSQRPMDCSLPGSPVNRILQEYWSGLAFLSPGDLPNPGIGPTSPEPAGRFFTTGPPGKPRMEVNSSSDFPLGQIPQEGLLPTRPPDVTPTDTSLPLPFPNWGNL